MTLWVNWIHIDEDYYVVKIKRGSYNHVQSLKYKLIGIGSDHCTEI